MNVRRIRRFCISLPLIVVFMQLTHLIVWSTISNPDLAMRLNSFIVILGIYPLSTYLRRYFFMPPYGWRLGVWCGFFVQIIIQTRFL